MKNYLLSLCCAALAGTAWAQSPASAPANTGTKNIVQVGAIFSSLKGGTTADCGPQTKTVCVAQPATVVKTKVLFSSSCETVCSKGICALLKIGKDCDSCQADGTCGIPYVKRDLYKRVEKTECPSFKCVTAEVPVCTTTSCPAQCAIGTGPGTVVSLPGTPRMQAPPTAALAITTTPIPTATPVAVRPTMGFVAVP